MPIWREENTDKILAAILITVIIINLGTAIWVGWWLLSH